MRPAILTIFPGIFALGGERTICPAAGVARRGGRGGGGGSEWRVEGGGSDVRAV
jgi:hypothetical protein